MKKLILVLFLIPGLVSAQTAKQLIKRLDQNENFRSERMVAEMIIQKGRRTLVKKFTAVSQKAGEKSFMTFINPEDKGVKYLKKKDNLWIYFPDADSVMKISGHMLRQGMMGSDISYDDMLNSGDLEKKYSSKLLPEKTVMGQRCYVLELKAKTRDASYARQVIYVNKTRMIPIKIEMYARGGRLLKEMTLKNYRRVNGYWTPFYMTIQDKRKRNSKTIIKIKYVRYNAYIPRGTFTRRNLKR